MLRVVVDTNVFVTALLFGKTPRRVYEAFLQGSLTPIFSPETLLELIDVLTRPSFRILISEAETRRFLELIQRDGMRVHPSRRIQICRDPKDNIILEAAVAGAATFIVTGDRDLLILSPFEGIPILRPSDFLRKLA